MKREVKIIALSYSQTQVSSYVVVLSEVNGLRKLPVIVKAQDAQTIALRIEGMKAPRPLTHDLFKTLCDGFNIDCQEISIYQVLEGIFYSKLSCHNGVDDVEIETTAGDAIALSLVFNCPLYVTEEVLASSGVTTNEDGSVSTSNDTKPKRKKKKGLMSIEDLKKMLQDAIANEDYEVAAEVRDKINKLESENGEEKNENN